MFPQISIYIHTNVFERLLNMGGIEIVNIIDNKVLVNNSEFSVNNIKK